MLVVAVIATILAFVQNTVMFSLGMKEMAIFAFPLSFVGIFLAEVVLIWAAYFCVRRFLRRSRALVLAGWADCSSGSGRTAASGELFHYPGSTSEEETRLRPD